MVTDSSGRSPGPVREPVVVVGGGIVGTSIAYHLRDEVAVTLIEKSTLGSGTTAASIAQFIEYQDAPSAEEAARRRRSWSFYDQLIADGIVGFDRVGTLQAATSDEDLASLESIATDLDRVDVTATVVTPAEMSQYGIDPETVQGGLLLPNDGVLDPTELVQFFAREARASGVTVETGTAVTDVHVEEGQVAGVATTEGTYEAGTVVNAAGPWAPHVDEMVGLSTSIRHTYGPILVLESAAEVTTPLTFFDGGYYVRQEGDRQLFAGSFTTAYEGATRIDPDESHAAAAGEQFRLDVADLLATHMPSYAPLDVTNSWVGVRTVTPDGHPLVGPTGVDGYVHATGMSGHGITLAPVVGELLASRLTTGETPTLMRELLPTRFDE